MNAARLLLLASLLAPLACAATGCAHREARTERPTPMTATGDGLSVKQRGIVPIAAFTAIGDLPKLRSALREGLQAGLTVHEIEEVLVQMYAYAGFPRSLNGLGAFIDVLEERRRRGVVDDVGRGPTPMPAGRSSVEVGAELQTKLVGGRVTAPYATFSPTVDAFLKGHLFGDILSRDNLDIQSREVATVSALASLEGVNPQLTSHVKVALNVGLSEAQLRHLIGIVRETVGRERGDNASEVLAQALRGRHGRPGSPAAAVAGPSDSDAPTIRVRRRHEQNVESAPAEHFTGAARVTRLFQPPEGARASGASVAFEAGARTAWHVHPLGQTLVVSEGTGWVQQRGGPAHVITAGDVVTIPPGVEHWHGASARSAMTHFALQEQVDGGSVRWLERVSDEQYEAAERGR